MKKVFILSFSLIIGIAVSSASYAAKGACDKVAKRFKKETEVALPTFKSLAEDDYTICSTRDSGRFVMPEFYIVRSGKKNLIYSATLKTVKKDIAKTFVGFPLDKALKKVKHKDILLITLVSADRKTKTVTLRVSGDEGDHSVTIKPQ